MSATDDRRHGFFMVDNELIEVHGRELGVYGLAVYAALAQQAGSSGRCQPSIPRLAGLLGCSPRKVADAIALLRRLGLVAIEERRGADKRQLSNDYRLLPVAKLEKYAATPMHQVPPPRAHSAATPMHQVPTNKNQDTKTQETSFANAQEVAEPPAPQVRRPRARRSDSSPPPRPATDREPTAIQALVDAFIDATGDTATPYARHVREAKALAADGRTPGDVVGCHRWIMADPRHRAFFAVQPYTLTTVRKYMRAYLTDPVPLAHVQACFVAILTGLGLEAEDLTADIQGDYWQAARQVVAAGAEPPDVRAAVGAALASNRANPNLPPSARMVAAALAGVRSRQRQVVTR